MIIDGPHKHQALTQSHASIPGSITQAEILGDCIIIMPDFLAGDGVDGKYSIPRRADVHDPISYQGSRRKTAIDFARLKGPDRNQLSDGCFINLVKRAVAPGVVSSRISQPVVWLLFSLNEAPSCNFSGSQETVQGTNQNQKAGNIKQTSQRLFPVHSCFSPFVLNVLRTHLRKTKSSGLLKVAIVYPEPTCLPIR